MAEASKRPVWDEDITHGTPLSTALQELIAHYNQTGEYTPKTADQIQQQAAGEYKTYYDQQRLSAQQAYDRNRLALEQQLAGIDRSYDKAREASAREYGDAYSQADRALLGRGMQRSSYGMQTLGNLAQRGLEAQQDIWDQQTQAEGNINAQQTQLAQQLADQLRQYDTSEQDATLARIRELEDQEYQRGVTNQNTRNQLSTQIYEYLRENNGSSGGNNGGNYQTDVPDTNSPAPDTPTPTNNPADKGKDPFATFMASLNNGFTRILNSGSSAGNTFRNPLNTSNKATSGAGNKKMLVGPVDLDVMDRMNKQSALTGTTYYSQLEEHLKNLNKK